MNTAGREWAAFIAARNKIETAKALSASGGPRSVATEASERSVPLSANASAKPQGKEGK